MKSKMLVLAGLLAVAITTGSASADVFVNLGASTQNFTLYGQGPVAPGVGSFRVGQGSSTYDVGTNTSTFTLSGTISSGSAGYGSGNYSFITTYAGLNTPEAGPLAPYAQSNPSNTNQFFYTFLDPTTTMTLDLFGTPTGDHVIPLVNAGNFLGPNFSFLFVSTTCTVVGSCGQKQRWLNTGRFDFWTRRNICFVCHSRCPRTFDMGHDDLRLRWRWLHGLSPS